MLLSEDPSQALEEKFRLLLDYVSKLTVSPASCRKEDVQTLREAGATDEEIHNAVQVASYFNYINRIADGLGVDLEPEMEG